VSTHDERAADESARDVSAADAPATDEPEGMAGGAGPPGLLDLGWDDAWAGTFLAHEGAGLRAGRVTAVHRETSRVTTATGEISAGVSGRFRRDAVIRSDYPAVGDWVTLEGSVITRILPRRSAFRRYVPEAGRGTHGSLGDEQVLAANVDVALLVAGLDRDFNLRRLERYLAVAWSTGVRPVIVLNKADIADDAAAHVQRVKAIAPGVPIVLLSALTRDRLADLLPYLAPGRTAVVLGSSGAGKSTLVNALLGEERQVTRAVREDDSRGRHTTTHRELFQLPGGAMLIDTPGIRALEVIGADEGVGRAFDDVTDLAARCRFADCRHEGEPGCAVLAAVAVGALAEDRLESWRKLEREAAHVQRREDPLARIDERRRWKTIHRSVRRHMQERDGELP
jgi:ribosome biogenesis GTPase / thiamine phosphate phosphatase